jgi:ABC-type Na+ efflux pump permease subunit
LVWKEVRQLPRKRGAALSAVFFPLLLLFVLPVGQMLGISHLPPDALAANRLPAGTPLPAVMEQVNRDPAAAFRLLSMPLVALLGGLVVPSVMATHTIVIERERRTLELLVALPVRAGDILLAKMLAMLVLAVGVAVPLFAIDAAAIAWLGLADLGYLLGLLLVLLAALGCSVCESLVLALLARDLRTTNNLNGALLTPVTVAIVAILLSAPPGLRLPALAALLLALAALAFLCAARWLTFERYLSS